MRLTLRTLLAYLDDILEPGDREDLQKQIDVSDYARDLVHRTRDVSRRLRLGSPEVLGSGPLDDPNTVAEYLDNTLPMENVPEFERVCLESDVMLAEVSASHHVLAMVLGKPAEVDPDTRQRMHELPSQLVELQKEAQKLRIEPAHTPALAPVASAAASAVASVASEGASVVVEPADEAIPDYLRQDRGTLLRWAPALAALALLATTGYMMLVPGAEPMWRLLFLTLRLKPLPKRMLVLMPAPCRRS